MNNPSKKCAAEPHGFDEKDDLPSKSNFYRIKNWGTHFEGAKSRTYKNKSSCTMPCKHGLGYKKMIRRKDGPANFGAWCALIQVLSRHDAPREGLCTDTGKLSGSPYTSEDLEILTGIPKRFFTSMFLTAQDIGWIELTDAKDTGRIPRGYQAAPLVPLNSNSDSNLNSDSNSNSRVERVVEYPSEAVRKICTCRPEFSTLNPETIAMEIHKAEGNTDFETHLNNFLADAANSIPCPKNPIGMLRSYLNATGRNNHRPTTGRATI